MQFDKHRVIWEYLMENRQASKLSRQLKRVFAEQAINALDKWVDFCLSVHRSDVERVDRSTSFKI